MFLVEFNDSREIREALVPYQIQAPSPGDDVMTHFAIFTAKKTDNKVSNSDHDSASSLTSKM